MNLTFMIFGSCDYLALSYTSPLKNQVTPPYELLEHHLNTHLLLNWKKSMKHISSSIINKCRNNYITGGCNWLNLKLFEHKNKSTSKSAETKKRNIIKSEPSVAHSVLHLVLINQSVRVLLVIRILSKMVPRPSTTSSKVSPNLLLSRLGTTSGNIEVLVHSLLGPVKSVKHSKNHQNVSRLGKTWHDPPFSKKKIAQKSCHVWPNVSRFGNVERTSNLTSKKKLGVKNRVMLVPTCHVLDNVERHPNFT